MGLFDSLFGKKKEAAPSRETQQKKYDGTFTFEPGVLTGRDTECSTATFKDGVVYFNYPYVGERAIGYYETEPQNPEKIIISAADRQESGFVDGKYIFLSRIGIYQRFKGRDTGEGGLEIKYPMPPSDLCGVIYDNGGSGSVYDANTDKRIGSYVGDKIGAAAAFVSLTEECHGETVYARFLTDWDKY